MIVGKKQVQKKLVDLEIGNDLLYFGDAKTEMIEIEEAIKEQWPRSQTKQDWDDIHAYRLEVILPAGVNYNQWYTWLLKHGIALCSLAFGIDGYAEDRAEELKALVEANRIQ